MPDHVSRLARKRMAAGLLFRDERARVLLVEPSYKPNWELPGGAVEADESPWDAAARELLEELGWRVRPGHLLVVDHDRAHDGRPEGVVFVFDGGRVSDELLARTTFPDGEVLSASLHTGDEVRAKVKPLLAGRIAAALVAVEREAAVMCDHGAMLG